METLAYATMGLILIGGCLTALIVTIECHRREAAADREAEIVQDYLRNPKAVERRLVRQALEHLKNRAETLGEASASLNANPEPVRGRHL